MKDINHVKPLLECRSARLFPSRFRSRHVNMSVIFNVSVPFFFARTLSHPISWCNNAIRSAPRCAASHRHYPHELKWQVCVGHRRWVISTNVFRDLYGGGISETAITIIGQIRNERATMIRGQHGSLIDHQLSGQYIIRSHTRSQALQLLGLQCVGCSWNRVILASFKVVSCCPRYLGEENLKIQFLVTKDILFTDINRI